MRDESSVPGLVALGVFLIAVLALLVWSAWSAA